MQVWGAAIDGIAWATVIAIVVPFSLPAKLAVGALVGAIEAGANIINRSHFRNLIRQETMQEVQGLAHDSKNLPNQRLGFAECEDQRRDTVLSHSR